MSTCRLIVEDWMLCQVSRNSHACLDFLCPKILVFEMSNECPCSSPWFARLDLGSCLLMALPCSVRRVLTLSGNFAAIALCTVVAVEHVDGVALVRCCNLVFVFGKVRCSLV